MDHLSVLIAAVLGSWLVACGFHVGFVMQQRRSSGFASSGYLTEAPRVARGVSHESNKDDLRLQSSMHRFHRAGTFKLVNVFILIHKSLHCLGRGS
ncbi:hypothetical protein AcV5_005556 [Taiwanofungus camphoratus]|nr:hypothetical protein AcV5_005556 [Antrodia cinnamomea]KAI0948802.1 hypothetical protein AcV7_009449 [Antrodia cinnamomea]